MQKLNNKNINIIVIIGVVLVTVIGATFAYFAAQLGDGTDSEINASSGTTDSLMFEKSGDIVITANQDDFYEDAPDKSQTETVKAILTPNDATKHASRTYNVFFIVDDNDFIYTTKELKTPEIIMQVKGPDGFVQNIQGLTPLEDKNAFDITTKRHMAFKIAENYPIEATDTPTTQTWEITVTLVNLDTIQNENGGKTLKGRVYITTEDIETYKLINVNSIIPDKDWHSITAVANIDEGTADVDKYYFAIEKTNEEPSSISFKTIAEALSYTYHESTDNSYTFNELDDGTPLEPNQNYKIYSYVIDKEGYRSNIYSEIIKTDDYKKVEIGNVSYETTWHSIKITGVETTSGTGQAKLYKFKKDIDGDWSSYSEDATIEYDNLEPSNTYTISVQVQDTNGKEGIHRDVQIKTDDYNNVTVESSVTEITDTSMKVVVSTTDGDGTVEKVEIQNGSGEYQQASLVDGKYVYTFSDLTAGENYTFNIKVTDSNGKIVTKTISARAHWKVEVTVLNGESVPAWAHVANGEDMEFTISANDGYDLMYAKVTKGTCELSDNNTKLIAKGVTSNLVCEVEIPKIEKLQITSIETTTINSTIKLTAHVTGGVAPYNATVDGTITCGGCPPSPKCSADNKDLNFIISNSDIIIDNLTVCSPKFTLKVTDSANNVATYAIDKIGQSCTCFGGDNS